MKAKYNREDDVLLIFLSDDRIDHAEESAGIVMHFSETGRPVLMEVLDASRFLASLTRITAHSQSGELVTVE
jgi:hypothetical protein